jgi:hypothetical protein
MRDWIGNAQTRKDNANNYTVMGNLVLQVLDVIEVMGCSEEQFMSQCFPISNELLRNTGEREFILD